MQQNAGLDMWSDLWKKLVYVLMPSLSWSRGLLWLPVLCHTDVAHLPGMDDLRVRYIVQLAGMDFCLFGGLIVLCFCWNALLLIRQNVSLHFSRIEYLPVCNILM
ncbi:hypothetical protein Nepgr_022894 [Nepenthes gracilis]|uniref:Uncharacterized protein n=1 Tax=Nepenthes gracilis TaxID=150966 RepID=A0AAD3T1P9_NEPGR|nr:hypothetical protein Nepgr_022894 [Nepenthes gracilis]